MKMKYLIIYGVKGIKSMTKTYIHYGNKKFDKNLFKIPKNNSQLNKPNGGLWASDIESKFGWKNWCEAESFRKCDKENSFCFKLSNNANIFKINSVDDVYNMPLQTNAFESQIIRIIDFELMIKNGIDVIEFNLSNDEDLYFALYGWDCDCILVLNPEVIIQI